MVLRFYYTLAFYLIICITSLFSQERGNASYYHKKLHGRRTASGLIYHKDSMTCAHRTLPFGTLLLVKNPQNNKQIVVKVTDRGPFRKKFTLDLSHKAAKELDIIQKGYATVEFSLYKKIPLLYETLEDPFPLRFTREKNNQDSYFVQNKD